MTAFILKHTRNAWAACNNFTRICELPCWAAIPCWTLYLCIWRVYCWFLPGGKGLSNLQGLLLWVWRHCLDWSQLSLLRWSHQSSPDLEKTQSTHQREHSVVSHPRAAVLVPRGTWGSKRSKKEAHYPYQHHAAGDWTPPGVCPLVFTNLKGMTLSLWTAPRAQRHTSKFQGSKEIPAGSPNVEAPLLSSLIFAALKQDQARSTLTDKHTAGMQQPPSAIPSSGFHSTKIFSILDRNFSKFESPRSNELPYSSLH